MVYCTGRQCFIVLRQQEHTVQCLAMVGPTTSKQMVKFIAGYDDTFFQLILVYFLKNFNVL